MSEGGGHTYIASIIYLNIFFVNDHLSSFYIFALTVNMAMIIVAHASFMCV